MNEIDENIKETIMDLDNLFSIFSFEISLKKVHL